MPHFPELRSDNDLKEIIQSAFGTQLDISGDWGYSEGTITRIHSTTLPIPQFQHTFASMRAYVEMNMTQEKENRYGSINLTEIKRESLSINTLIHHKITYRITAMQEVIYTNFIKEYKEQYGQKDFDLTAHFKAREKASLVREVIHWFETTEVK